LALSTDFAATAADVFSIDNARPFTEGLISFPLLKIFVEYVPADFLEPLIYHVGVGLSFEPSTDQISNEFFIPI
jgi:hypothetical protein